MRAAAALRVSADGARSARSRRAARWLAALCVLLATHGSLYPWRFARPASFAVAWDGMMHQSTWWTGRGDVVGNVMLFVPLGALGWIAWRYGRWPPTLRAALLLATGVAFAFALQVAQIYVPSRDAAWSDVVWNTLGLLIGMLLATPLARLPIEPLQARALRLPLMFVALWLALQWWPFVPRLDWQHMKDALKPLLLHPQWRTGSAIDSALSLALVGVLLRGLQRRAWWLVALPVVAAFGALLVEHQFLSLSRCAGWLGGVLLALLAWRLPPRVALALGSMFALAWFTYDELKPFQLGDASGRFQWVPFAALLQGSMSANTLALTWQLFWQGAILATLGAGGVRVATPALALGLWALLLEVLQIWLPGRTPDITPALLPWLWVWILALLEVSSRGAVNQMRCARSNPPETRPLT